MDQKPKKNFEAVKQDIVNLIETTQLKLKLQTREKYDASHNGFSKIIIGKPFHLPF